MPNIAVLGIRFNLDKPEDKELYEALYRLPEGQRVRTTKEALRKYLLAQKAQADEGSSKRKPSAQKNKNTEPREAASSDQERLPTQTAAQPVVQNVEQVEQPAPSENKNHIIENLKSMIQ